MRRTLYGPEHEHFRSLVRAFFENECAPHVDEWERRGHVDREVWRKAGKAGLLLWEAPEEYGGLGIKDFRYNAIIHEEFSATGVSGFGISMQNDVMPPYLLDLSTEEQRARWLPGSVKGDIIWAIAMSEPGAGSDLKTIRTTARREGDEYVLDGAKTFITNGLLADNVIVVCKTDPDAGHRGISLLVVEEGMPGFARGRRLDKIGLRSQDTAELSFTGVRVPAANLLGTEGRGFYHLMAGLRQERVSCAAGAVAAMERALALTVEHVRNREVFGEALGAMQNTRFQLAEIKTVVDVARTYLDKAVMELTEDTLTAPDAAGLKQWATDRQGEVIDRCLQFFGGYGYMNEYEIARLYRDARVTRIMAGSNEVMKEIVGRSMKLEGPADE